MVAHAAVSFLTLNLPMTRITLFLCALSVFVAGCTSSRSTVPPATTPAATNTTVALAQPLKPSPVDASVGAPKTNNELFFKKHEEFLERAKSGPIGVLFLGDSITAGWSNAHVAFRKYYGRHHPANFGIGGDQTQHVIWRLENGELEGINPRLVVLMIGTNNTGGHNSAQILAGNAKIISLIRAKLPKTKILLLGIFPRDARKNREGVITDAAIADANARMAIIREVNAGLAKMDDGRNVRFLDISSAFLDENGKIPESIMPDQLHLSLEGYERWAKAMDPLFFKMMR
jgi:lysophospholipase L1-like esterase